MHRLSVEIGRPVSFAMLQFDSRPNQWRELVEICKQTREQGANVVAQYASRPFGILTGHQTDANVFSTRPAYVEIQHLPLAERVERLKDPAVREAILGPDRCESGWGGMLDSPAMLARIFPMGDPPDYEPTADKSIAAIAEREGRPADHVLYDYMLKDEGKELLLIPFFNYADGNLELMLELMHSEATVLSLGDGGAHCGAICDASLPARSTCNALSSRRNGSCRGSSPRLCIKTRYVVPSWYQVTIVVHSPASVGASRSPTSAFSSVLLPAFTFPAMATRRGSSRRADSAAMVCWSGWPWRAATVWSTRNPTRVAS